MKLFFCPLVAIALFLLLGMPATTHAACVAAQPVCELPHATVAAQVRYLNMHERPLIPLVRCRTYSVGVSVVPAGHATAQTVYVLSDEVSRATFHAIDIADTIAVRYPPPLLHELQVVEAAQAFWQQWLSCEPFLALY